MICRKTTSKVTNGTVGKQKVAQIDSSYDNIILNKRKGNYNKELT